MHSSFPNGVLFDHDGVLVASEALHAKAWRLLFTELGLDTRSIEMHEWVGRTAPMILQSVFKKLQHPETLTEKRAQELANRKNEFYLEIAQNELQPCPGVLDLLEILNASGIGCSIITNAKRRELDFSLDSLGLRPFFKTTFSRDDVPNPKPAPDICRHAAASLGVDPLRCIGIDDSPTGLQSILTAGVTAISVTTNFSAEDLRWPVPGLALTPIYIGNSMEDVRDFIVEKFTLRR